MHKLIKNSKKNIRDIQTNNNKQQTTNNKQTMNSQIEMQQSNEWTTVIGNGKRMGRQWRQQAVMGEKDILFNNTRECTIYAPGFDTGGYIVDDDLMRTWLPQWGASYYDPSLQPDEGLY